MALPSVVNNNTCRKYKGAALHTMPAVPSKRGVRELNHAKALRLHEHKDGSHVFLLSMLEYVALPSNCLRQENRLQHLHHLSGGSGTLPACVYVFVIFFTQHFLT
ncbi:unnamed protein product [Ixodes pacificus]